VRLLRPAKQDGGQAKERASRNDDLPGIFVLPCPPILMAGRSHPDLFGWERQKNISHLIDSNAKFPYLSVNNISIPKWHT
jgi:hypothetical protein